MQQVLLNLPFTAGFFPPDGLPVYGFGAMLFLTFVLTAMLWGPLRAVKVGLPKDRLQDFAILLFITGIAGARVVYMMQYRNQFPSDFIGLVKSFFQIWNGGIVVYGAVFGGLIGYLFFYRIVLRKFNVSGWKLADAVAPLIAFGMAVGRIGCYLNGCCWGQPVCEECQPVPISATLGEFPLMPAHARDQVILPARADDRMPQIRGLQTSTGFAIAPRLPLGIGDPRSLVVALEPNSPAERAGLKVGDRVTQVNGKPNYIVVELLGNNDLVTTGIPRLTDAGGTELPTVDAGDGSRVARVGFDDAEKYKLAVAQLQDLRVGGMSVYAMDSLWELVRDWPRGKSELALGVNRSGETVTVKFTPKTVAFFPTQLYETISMALLVGVLVTFQPFRRHDGQLIVLLMLGYAAHRFLNEAIRIEPTYALDLTLSQWISIGIFCAGLTMEAYLRVTMPKLPNGLLPLSHGVAAV